MVQETTMVRAAVFLRISRPTAKPPGSSFPAVVCTQKQATEMVHPLLHFLHRNRKRSILGLLKHRAVLHQGQFQLFCDTRILSLRVDTHLFDSGLSISEILAERSKRVVLPPSSRFSD